jgi:hypothetical protein
MGELKWQKPAIASDNVLDREVVGSTPLWPDAAVLPTRGWLYQRVLGRVTRGHSLPGQGHRWTLASSSASGW